MQPHVFREQLKRVRTSTDTKPMYALEMGGEAVYK